MPAIETIYFSNWYQEKLCWREYWGTMATYCDDSVGLPNHSSGLVHIYPECILSLLFDAQDKNLLGAPICTQRSSNASDE